MTMVSAMKRVISIFNGKLKSNPYKNKSPNSARKRASADMSEMISISSHFPT